MKNEYPYMLYTSVLLLDGRIENWKTGDRHWNNIGTITLLWNFDRIKDYKVKWTGWFIENVEQNEKVFNILSHKWLKQWEYAKDYHLMKDR